MRLMIAFVLSALAALPLAADPAQIRPVSRATAMDQLVDASVALPVRDISADVRPIARDEIFPRMRWDHRGEHALWTRAAMEAVQGHGAPLVQMVPGDIADWCPAYPENGPEARAAFWVGFMSALSKHESTYKPRAVGGGGKWYGLLQILPATARGYGCRAGTGEALKSGPANLSCAARIMAVTVQRDGVIHARQPRWSGVSADWGPMRSPSKRADMANWLKKQSYCKSLKSLRPSARPFN
ncbi:MAG: transglycosylase SLT domain-containing protein [Pseudomonadota bacterium]